MWHTSLVVIGSVLTMLAIALALMNPHKNHYCGRYETRQHITYTTIGDARMPFIVSRRHCVEWRDNKTEEIVK